MEIKKEKDFFDNIRRSVKWSYVISSLFPLIVTLYILYRYVFPMADQNTKVHIGILFLFILMLSVLGLIVTTRVTNASISSAESLQEKLNSLIEITKQFRETLYIDILLESIIKSAIHLNSAESGSLLLYDETGTLKFKVAVGNRSEKVKSRTVKRGEGVSGWVAETGKSAIINDVTGDKRFDPAFDKESGYKTRSIMCVPLIHNKEIIGVIEVLNKKEGQFTHEDEKLLYSLADQASISITQSRVYESRHSDLIHITEILLSSQDFHSPNKKGHARRTANYANLIGRSMKLSETELKNLYYASLFHDIGFLKIKTADHSDMEKVKKHPSLGYEMIKPIAIWKDAAEMMISHHERYDGKGYPAGKKGDEIPLGSRILNIASTFDVITSNHSYKEKIDFNAAIREIDANSGTQFDPQVVQIFKNAIKDSDLAND